MRSNVNHSGGAAKGSGLGESPEPYHEEGADERVGELSVSESQEEDEKLDLVLGKLLKSLTCLTEDTGQGMQMKVTINLQLNLCL